MAVIGIFTVDSNKSIEIVLPDLNDKVNYYYKTSATLHIFDAVMAVLKINGIEVLLCTDTVNEVLMSFSGSLEQLLHSNMVLPDNIDIGNLGSVFNINIHNKNFDAVNFSQFWLWPSPAMQSWLYSKNGKLYLEVAPSYLWLYVEPTQKEKVGAYISFEQCMQTYKPVLVTEIDRSLAQKWFADCTRILDDVAKGAY